MNISPQKDAINFETILVDSSRAIAEFAVDFIAKNSQYFNDLMQLAFAKKHQLSMRAAHVAEMCTAINPDYFNPYIEEILKNIGSYDEGVKRSFLKFFFTYNERLNDEMTGLLVDHCFRFLNGASEAIAVKHYSSKILYEISNKEPDLKYELIAVLEDQIQKNNNLNHRFRIRMLEKLYDETKLIKE